MDDRTSLRTTSQERNEKGKQETIVHQLHSYIRGEVSYEPFAQVLEESICG